MSDSDDALGSVSELWVRHNQGDDHGQGNHGGTQDIDHHALHKHCVRVLLLGGADRGAGVERRVGQVGNPL